MYKYMMEHEKYILKMLESENNNLEEIIEYHRHQIEFLQHERLLHLMVTIAFGVLLLGVFILFIFSDNFLYAIVILILLILEIFYIIHYYRLENGVQRWYKLYNSLTEKNCKPNKITP